MTSAGMALEVQIDPEDIVTGLRDNDELILSFIVEVLEVAGSSDLRERLRERLAAWDDEHNKEGGDAG